MVEPHGLRHTDGVNYKQNVFSFTSTNFIPNRTLKYDVFLKEKFRGRSGEATISICFIFCQDKVEAKYLC